MADVSRIFFILRMVLQSEPTFYGTELYDFSGKYVGEIRKQNRIIVNKSRKTNENPGKVSHAGFAMLAGYEDFEFEQK